MNRLDHQLQSAIDALNVPGVLVRHRIISPGDEHALLPDESDALAKSVVKVRRASGAARIAARELLVRLGQPDCALPKSASGAPIWPSSIVGSLAHDADVAVAAAARSRDVSALGVDVEPAHTLPIGLLDWIATLKEKRNIHADAYGGRVLFAAKEAAYKALNDESLDYQNIAVDLTTMKVTASNGKNLALQICMSSHIVALAYSTASCVSEPIGIVPLAAERE